ncbi:MAG: hypothetical protein FJ368_03855 [Pelagibacterales bacterium]|nr:hypothetical protein [Pelagibacterales bacterium]
MFSLIVAIFASIGIVSGVSSGGGGSGGSVSSGGSNYYVDSGGVNGYTTSDAEYYKTTEYQKQWGLDSINAADAYAYLSSNNKEQAGEGVKIGITDTGVKLTHQEISANDSGLGYDFDNYDSSVTDSSGHGTHVASTAAGVRDGNGMHGVAYNSEIIAVQMMNSSEYGIEYAANKGAGVINMSWAFSDANGNSLQLSIGGSTYEAIYDSMQSEFDAAIASNSGLGSVLVAANGNDSYTNYISAPAIFSQDSRLNGIMIAVGSVNKESDGSYSISDFSNQCKQAKEYCLVAPGGYYNESGIYAAGISSNSSYTEKVGTSMATPHVTGAAAVIRAAWPLLTAAETVQILLDTATDLGASGTDDIYGKGMLNLYEAVQAQGTTILSSGTRINSSGYTVDQTSINSDPIFGDAFTKNVATELRSTVFFDKYGRDYKANLDKNITARSSYTVPTLDSIAFNNYNSKTIPISFGINKSSKLQLELKSYNDNNWKSSASSINYGLSSNEINMQNNFGLKHLVVDRSKEDSYLTKSQGFSFTQDFSKNFQAGFAFNTNEADNLKQTQFSNIGFISVSNFAANPYQNFVSSSSYSADLSNVRNFNQLFVSKKFMDNKFALTASHQTSYNTNSNFSKVSNIQNQVSDFTFTYLPGSDSSTSLSFGNLNEFDNNLLNSKSLGAFSTAGNSKTSYFKISSSRKLAEDLYLISSFSEGQTQANGNNQGIFRSYEDIKSRSSSVGLVNNNIFGGKIGFIYSEPMRVYSGKASINVPVARDSSGIVRYSSTVSLKPTGKEQDLELFYSRNLSDNSQVKFNFITQKQPGNIKDAESNYLGFMSYGLKF